MSVLVLPGFSKIPGVTKKSNFSLVFKLSLSFLSLCLEAAIVMKNDFISGDAASVTGPWKGQEPPQNSKVSTSHLIAGGVGVGVHRLTDIIITLVQRAGLPS